MDNQNSKQHHNNNNDNTAKFHSQVHQQQLDHITHHLPSSKSGPKLSHLDRDRGPKGRKLPATYAKKVASSPQSPLEGQSILQRRTTDHPPLTLNNRQIHSDPYESQNPTSDECVYLSFHELNHYDRSPNSQQLTSPILNEAFRLSFTEELKDKVRRKRFGCLNLTEMEPEAEEEEEDDEDEDIENEDEYDDLRVEPAVQSEAAQATSTSNNKAAQKKVAPKTLPKPDVFSLVGRVATLEALNQEMIGKVIRLEELVVNLSKEISDLRSEVDKGKKEDLNKNSLRSKLIIPNAFQVDNTN